MKRMLTLVLAILLAVLPGISLAEDSFEPLYCTAYMEIGFKCGCSRIGTGAMIGRYGMVTAAHNLVCVDHSEGLKTCILYFGMKDSGDYWYKYDGKLSYTAYNNFKNGYNNENDIGYIIFEEAVGDKTGWYGWRVPQGSDLTNPVQALNFDKKYTLWHVYGKTLITINEKNSYWVDDIITDAEGGPVYIWKDGEEFPQVIGVYSSWDSSKNRGFCRLLTKEFIDDMRADGAFGQ